MDQEIIELFGTRKKLELAVMDLIYRYITNQLPVRIICGTGGWKVISIRADNDKVTKREKVDDYFFTISEFITKVGAFQAC